MKSDKDNLFHIYFAAFNFCKSLETWNEVETKVNIPIVAQDTLLSEVKQGVLRIGELHYHQFIHDSPPHCMISLTLSSDKASSHTPF